jgi:hypothetical protein
MESKATIPKIKVNRNKKSEQEEKLNESTEKPFKMSTSV